MNRRLLLILCALGLAALATAVYHQVADNEFIWDDPIVLNQQLPYFDSLRNVFVPPGNIPQFADHYYRPIIVISYQLDEWLSKTFWAAEQRDRARRIVFHSSCVVYHVLNTVIVFFLGLALTRLAGPKGELGTLGALIGAALFATHPIHVESVAWMTGRSDVVCSVFFALSLLLYVVHRQRRHWLALVGALLAALLAMLSKETGMGLVLVIPLVDLLSNRDVDGPVAAISRAERRRQERMGRVGSTRSDRAGLSVAVGWGLFAVVAVIYLLLREKGLASMNASAARPAETQLTNLLGASGWFVLEAFWPWPQSAFISTIPKDALHIGLGLLVPLALLVLLVRAIRKPIPGWGRELVLAALFFAGAAPSLAIALFRISETPLAERYLYIPTIGFCLLLGGLIERLATRIPRRELRAAVALLVGLCVVVPWGIAAYRRGSVWQNNLALWSDTVLKAPDQGLPHLHLGITLAEQYDSRKDPENWKKNEWLAVQQYELALSTYDDAEGRSKAHNNLGSSYIALGDFPKAIEHFKQATEIDRKYPNAHYNWGLALLNLAQQNSSKRSEYLSEAAAHLRKALEFNPRYVKAHLQLGNLLLRGGAVEQGRQHLNQVLQLAPASFEAQSAREILAGTTSPK